MPVDVPPSLLEPFRRAPGRAAVITDFDGTLSLIVDDPADARPLPGVRDLLGSLARRYATVAVVSGRPVEFLAEHVGTEVVLSGLYGLECWVDGGVQIDGAAEPWRDVVVQAAADAADAAPDGVGVEFKGLSVTLHYRTAPERAEWCRQWSADTAARTGLGLHPARMSYELRPPVVIDKGTVVARLATDHDAVCFFGDDRGDLPAFAALDRLAKATGITTLKVVVESAEAPPEVLREADVLVPGPEGTLEVLRLLLDT